MATTAGDIPIPVKGDSTVMWTDDMTASEVASELELGLERRNEPLHDFLSSFALEQLQRSVETMRSARSAGAASPSRLRGSLELRAWRMPRARSTGPAAPIRRRAPVQSSANGSPLVV
jgi:hypothetical protein